VKIDSRIWVLSQSGRGAIRGNPESAADLNKCIAVQWNLTDLAHRVSLCQMENTVEEKEAGIDRRTFVKQAGGALLGASTIGCQVLCPYSGGK